MRARRRSKRVSNRGLVAEPRRRSAGCDWMGDAVAIVRTFVRIIAGKRSRHKDRCYNGVILRDFSPEGSRAQRHECRAISAPRQILRTLRMEIAKLETSPYSTGHPDSKTTTSRPPPLQDANGPGRPVFAHAEGRRQSAP